VTRAELIFKVCRDFGLLFLGIGGIIHQEWTGRPLPALLAVYTTLLGIPGAAALLALLKRPATGTTTSLPASAPPASSQASPPSSTP
jgi:hypothetical protein